MYQLVDKFYLLSTSSKNILSNFYEHAPGYFLFNQLGGYRTSFDSYISDPITVQSECEHMPHSMKWNRNNLISITVTT